MSTTAVNPKDALGLKKPPLHLVPPALVLWVSRVFGFSAGLQPSLITGRLKAVAYGPYNWREKKVIRSIYIDAMERHLLALKDGEDIDPESGLPHEAHIAANCGIMLDARGLGCLHNDTTWKPGFAPKLIAELTVKDAPPSADVEIRAGVPLSFDIPKMHAVNQHGVRVPMHVGCVAALRKNEGSACDACSAWDGVVSYFNWGPVK